MQLNASRTWIDSILHSLWVQVCTMSRCESESAGSAACLSGSRILRRTEAPLCVLSLSPLYLLEPFSPGPLRISHFAWSFPALNSSGAGLGALEEKRIVLSRSEKRTTNLSLQNKEKIPTVSNFAFHFCLKRFQHVHFRTVFNYFYSTRRDTLPLSLHLQMSPYHL